MAGMTKHPSGLVAEVGGPVGGHEWLNKLYPE